MRLYICNICESKQASFKSIESDLGRKLNEAGFPYELKDFETLNYKNYECEHCGASDRDRLYALYFNKFIGDKQLKIIDFAPSSALSTYLSKYKKLSIRTADLYMKNVDDKIDIMDMKKYKDQQFDFFICSHVLEHVTDDTKALNELFRILKPGGQGILMTPIINKAGIYDEDLVEDSANERWRRFAQDDHVRLYEKDIFLKRVKSAGFQVTEIKKEYLGRFTMLRHAISLRSVLYVVSKPQAE